LNKKNVTVTNNNGSSTYTFDKNGEFTFELKDEAGNIGKVVAKTSSIKEETSSSEETLVNIRYSTTSLTSGTVLATIYSNKELTVTNNGGSNVYEFDKNGDFTFKYIDGDGKEGSLTATVSWIQKSNTTTSSTDTSNSEASTTTNNSPSNTSQSNSTNSETTDNTDKNTDANVSQTGDKNNILLFAGIGFISLVGMFIGLKNNKKD
jgi:LPXTG-motif cell wall-anchored protein